MIAYGLAGLVAIAALLGYLWLRRPTHSQILDERDKRDRRTPPKAF
jgi:hypothetical protein